VGHVRAQVSLGGLRVSDAEALWYDTDRWEAFVDGFARVVSRDGEWPAAPGSVTWESTPAGRGRVVERVAEYEARVGQTSEVEDPRMVGTQRIAFASRDGGVTVTLTLDYALRQGGPLRPLLDALFVRGPMRDSLRRTLGHFERELTAETESSG
jgi:hypothetical protein